MDIEAPNAQQFVAEVADKDQDDSDNQTINTKIVQSECLISDNSSSEEAVSGASPFEESESNDLVITKLEEIEKLISEMKTSDERYMMSMDIIDALNSTLEESLEKSRTEITMSTLTDVAIAREKYKGLCEAIVSGKSSLSIDEVIGSFSNFAIELENILLRQNVIIFDDTGKKFDPSRNVLEKIEFSDDMQNNLIISEACSEGYSINGKIIYPQRARVIKYQKKVE